MKKIVNKTCKFLKQNLVFILFFVLVFLVLNLKLSYNIYTPGGLINVEDKVNIEGYKQENGSFNLTYVTTYDANVLMLLMAKFNNNWLVEGKGKHLLSNETEDDEEIRSKILLQEGSQNSIIYAYKMANKPLSITGSSIYVICILDSSNATLKIGDKILEVGGVKISSIEDIQNIINNYNIGDMVTLKTDNGIRRAQVLDIDGEKKMGISVSTIYDIDADITFDYQDNENGSSGGLLSTLYVYNYLMGDSLARGKKIAGTGTIDLDGNIGEISGVKFKLIGAVNNNVDVFFVPEANYEEAMALKYEKGYTIDIVKVNTFMDAVDYLNNL
ncbi:MAG: hypothetical protein PHD02_02110 [Bacilli bacterium]|nr:hypothetical protein [Bacilli bacterium]